MTLRHHLYCVFPRCCIDLSDSPDRLFPTLSNPTLPRYSSISAADDATAEDREAAFNYTRSRAMDRYSDHLHLHLYLHLHLPTHTHSTAWRLVSFCLRRYWQSSQQRCVIEHFVGIPRSFLLDRRCIMNLIFYVAGPNPKTS